MSNQPHIEVDAGADAAEEVIAVMHAAFAQYSAGRPSGALLETPETLRAELAAGSGLAIARVDGEVVGMAKHRVEGDALYFSRVGVLPSMRGRGIAGSLVRALRTHAHSLGVSGLQCSVRADETGNIALYEHLGMRIIERGVQRSLTGAMTPVVVMRDA